MYTLKYMCRLLSTEEENSAHKGDISIILWKSRNYQYVQSAMYGDIMINIHCVQRLLQMNIL